MNAKPDTLKVGTLYRSAEIERAAVDGDKGVVTLSFSSELPVERWFGYEILDHNPDSVDLSRLRSGAPLLVEHSRGDQVGVVEEASIQDRRGVAKVRFGSGARAQEIFQDVKDGIRRLVSVGYRVTKMVTEKVENEVETLRATGWQPMEISIVSIPADPTVGIGRADDTETNTVIIQRSKTMDPNTQTATPAAPPAAPINIEVIKADTRRAIQEQNNEILAMSAKMEKRWPEIADIRDRALAGEISLADFKSRAWELTTNAKPLNTQQTQSIGMTEKEIKQYSFKRAVLMAYNQKLEGYEKEVHDEVCRQYGLSQRAPNSIIVPHDVLCYSKRDQLVATGSLGGNVVATNLLASSFIDVLRNRMVTAQAGVQMLPGIVGNTVVPRQTAGSAVAWVGETSAATEASLTFDQITLTPKTISTYVDYSWLLLQQSTPAIDAIVRNDVQATIARGIDLAVLSGTGSTQPTGIASVSGIGSVAIGTNGGAPTWASVVQLETEVAQDNADVASMTYITNAKVRGKMKTVVKGTTATDSNFIWGDAGQPGIGVLNGYRALVSNACRSNLTKGTSTTVCSEIFFGDWSQLLLGMWSGLELLADPYTGATGRVLRLHAYQAVDLACRHPESFSYLADYTTT